MRRNFPSKINAYLASAILIFSSLLIFVPISSPTSDLENWSFKQEIPVPIDTSQENAKYQPIDIRIEFDNPCWAKNETRHSVRVAFKDNSGFNEIESQIYDLNFTDDEHIKACSLVFLIPEEANGKEEYYVFYDDNEKPLAEYTDRVTVEESHFYYEPISGQVMNWDYYKVMQDEYCVYGICQKGSLLGEGVSQMVIKQKNNKKEFMTTNWDQLAGFEFLYSYKNGDNPENMGTADATSVSTEILVDGNLMVMVGITGKSPQEDLESTNIYRYYYCPTDDKRLSIQVKHRALKECEVIGREDIDGVYASLVTAKSRSATIEKMNTGDILPKIHFHGEDGTIGEYDCPSNPSSPEHDWILSIKDDCDLGKSSWVSTDEGESGKGHGLIFGSNENIVENEEDGLQITAFSKEHVNIPGLEADYAAIYIGRNSYEMGGTHNKVIEEGFTAEFDVEFFTSENNSYKSIIDEAEIYQELVKQRPLYGANVTREKVEKGKYNLTVYTHFSPSIASWIAINFEKPLPLTSVELYKGEDLLSSGTAARLHLKKTPEIEENMSIFETLKELLTSIDWKKNIQNFFMKRITFRGLSPGKYLIKVYRERGNESSYVGVKTIELKEEMNENNITTHIWCGLEGSLSLSVIDQNGKDVENAQACIFMDENITIAKNFTNQNGETIIKVPCSLMAYQVKVFYTGFLIYDEKIRLLKPSFLSPKKISPINIELFDFNLVIRDKLGLPPGVDLRPTLTSDEMERTTVISAQQLSLGKYVFTDLYAANYTLNLKYKSFVMEERIGVSDYREVAAIFPAEFELNIDVLNSRGETLENADVSLSREGEIIDGKAKEGTASFLVPPGAYTTTINLDGKRIGNQEIDVKGEKNVEFLTDKEPIFPLIITFMGMTVAAVGALFLWFKKDFVMFTKILAISLIIVAIISPWWALSGEKGSVETSTKTYLVPPKLVTLTSTEDVLGGNVASVPEEFTQVMGLIPMILSIGAVFLFLSILFKKKISMALSLVAIILLIIGIIIFSYGMSALAEVGIGSFYGNGILSVSIPGTGENVDVSCNWGAAVGFYLSIAALAIVIIPLILAIFKRR